MSPPAQTARLGYVSRARSGTTRVLHGLGWIVATVLIAVGGAGLVVTIDHPATGIGRPELTARGDAAFAAAMPAVRDALARLGSAADELSEAGREAASALRAGDTSAARAHIADGEGTLALVTVAADDLAAARDELMRRVGDARLGARAQERLASVQASLDAAAQLPDAWGGVAGSTEPAATEGLIGIERVRGTLSEATAALD